MPRPPRARPSVWPLIMLLAGLALLAGILAAVFAFTGGGDRLKGLVDKSPSGGGAVKPVPLRGVAAYDPYGDRSEHDSSAGSATDGDPGTYWNTEHYNGGLQKQGVGLVLDAGGDKKLTRFVLRSDTPGFTAVIEAGASRSGPFTRVSEPQSVGDNTTFSLSGDAARYYVVWITDLGSNSSVQVDEVAARGR